jgi:hypothetical protein
LAELRVEVVDLVCSALDAADLVVDIIDLSSWACCAEVVDQIESGFANASGQNPILVGSADGGAHSVAALTTCFLVASNTVTALVNLVINLGFWVAGRADTSN